MSSSPESPNPRSRPACHGVPGVDRRGNIQGTADAIRPKK